MAVGYADLHEALCVKVNFEGVYCSTVVFKPVLLWGLEGFAFRVVVVRHPTLKP